ncbi:MAG TPA: hypothetical protein VK668_18120 [Mucilaginibacter sp.]|nr:hypothetical protein [Mucilaginibacter sp.]
MPEYQTNQPSPQSLIKTISIIHLGLLAGQVMLGAVAFFLYKQTGFDIKTYNDPLLYLVPIVAITCAIVGNLLYKQLIAKLTDKNSLREKLTGHQTASITRFALLEGPSLFGIVAYMSKGNLFFLLISGIIMLYFLSLRPTTEKVASDLNLSYEDKMELDSSIQ